MQDEKPAVRAIEATGLATGPRDHIYYGTRDPDTLINGVPIPAMTSLLYGVCGSDPRKFNEALRLLDLFLDTAGVPK